nr:hypothetical protein CFP56_70979 [Quercus suber]
MNVNLRALGNTLSTCGRLHHRVYTSLYSAAPADFISEPVSRAAASCSGAQSARKALHDPTGKHDVNHGLYVQAFAGFRSQNAAPLDTVARRPARHRKTCVNCCLLVHEQVVNHTLQAAQLRYPPVSATAPCPAKTHDRPLA